MRLTSITNADFVPVTAAETDVVRAVMARETDARRRNEMTPVITNAEKDCPSLEAITASPRTQGVQGVTRPTNAKAAAPK